MDFKIKRDPKQLRYLVKETETAIRMMFRDKQGLHLFDVGTTTEGTKWVCMIVIAPEERITRLSQAIDQEATPENMQETPPL